jgi:hypothetical protein
MTVLSYYNKKGQKVELRKDEAHRIIFWKVVNGISEEISEKKFQLELKKYNTFN